MMPFSEFRAHLDWRVDEGGDVSIRSATAMARAYFVLSDDEGERRKAREFINAQIRKLSAAATTKAEGGAA